MHSTSVLRAGPPAVAGRPAESTGEAAGVQAHSTDNAIAAMRKRDFNGK